MEDKKINTLSMFLNVNKKDINGEKSKSFIYKKNHDEYYVLNKSERKNVSLFFIEIYAFTDDWSYTVSELTDLFQISREEFLDLIVPERLVNSNLVFEDEITGKDLRDIVVRTIGEKEFQRRLFLMLDRSEKIPSLLSRYQHQEYFFDEQYIYPLF